MDGNIVEVVTSFRFIGVLITRNGLCDKDIRRRIGMGTCLTTIYGNTGESSLPQKLNWCRPWCSQ